MTDYINNKTINNKYKCFEIIVNIPSPISAEKVMTETGLSRSAANVYMKNLFHIGLYTKVRMGHVNMFYRTRKQLNFDDCAKALKWEEITQKKAETAKINMTKLHKVKGMDISEPFEKTSKGVLVHFEHKYFTDKLTQQAQQYRAERKPQRVAIGSTFGMV